MNAPSELSAAAHRSGIGLKRHTWLPTDLLICISLLMGSLIVFAQTIDFDFVNYDDPEEVSHNSHVVHGVTKEGLQWALTSHEDANWMPVTKVSHLIDVQLFRLTPGWHHIVNVVLHGFAAIFLFLFLEAATGSRWASGFTAALFAVHPLHVESVAWISERKDVLSAIFWFITLWLYVRYVEERTRSNYVLVFVTFSFALLSKSMAVTLPFVLLLMDFWPLARVTRLPLGSEVRREQAASGLVMEKLPFFAVSALIAIVTFLTQRGAGAMGLESSPIALRVQNAFLSYAIYLVKFFWPTHLAVFYPYPSSVLPWQVVLSLLVLGVISYGVWFGRRVLPFLVVGWLWFLGTLVPVIGLVQVGAQARADRYMYIPLVGIAIMLAWSGQFLITRYPAAKNALTVAAGICVLGSAILSGKQLQNWRNSETLFRHALAVTTDNYLAETNLGEYLAETRNNLPKAVQHLQAALRLRPDFAEAHASIGLAFLEMGRPSEAISQLRAAVNLKPTLAAAHNNLGSALAKAPGNQDEAISEFKSALTLNPSYAEAHNNLGAALSALPGHSGEAISEFEAALTDRPEYPDALNNLGLALLRSPGNGARAVSYLELAVRVKPDFPEARNNLGLALSQTPARLEEAIGQYEEALRLKPNFPEAQFNLGSAYLKEGKTTESITHFQAALRMRPDYGNAHYGLGVALKQSGRIPEAIEEYEQALRIHEDPALRQVIEQLKEADSQHK